ncbi:MAG: hypothetical protein A2026_13975 [Deltaproteobacteria bacterium RBG_19FT_COMBO_46_12]|nr:MAG: hypothetical protein A2026_13975 [Deltaproteobacteria bacterium RBG_19FT_COMBO_46_12]
MKDHTPSTKEIREHKKKFIIANLKREDFCAILNYLPNKFKIELTNLTENLIGCWEKRIYSPLQLETVWKQGKRVLYGSDLFPFREEVFQAIEKEGWEALDDLLLKYFKARIKKGEITQAPTKEKLEELYIEQKKSLKDIAIEFGCSGALIQNIMK